MKKLLLFLSIIFFFGNNNNAFGQDGDKIYEMNEVEKKADFPDGHKEFRRFITNNYEFPKKFIRMGIEGKSKIEFIIEKDGSLSNIKAFMSSEYDENMVNTIKKMSKWIPAMHNNKVVRSKLKYVIIFCKMGY